LGIQKNVFNFDGEPPEKWLLKRGGYYGNCDQKQTELVQDYVQWQSLVLAVLKLILIDA
jgi:hypothetical protein